MRFRHLVGVALLLAVFSITGAVQGANPSTHEPTYGTAVKDGNPDTGGPGAEWQYRPSAGYPSGFDFWGARAPTRWS